MSEKGRDHLVANKIDRRYPAGSYIFRAGETPEGLYCVQRGLVKLEAENPRGELRLINVLQAGDLLGYRALFAGDSYQWSAYAAEDTLACFVPRARMLELMRHEPVLALEIIGRLSREMRSRESRLCQATDLSALGRVTKTLLFFKDKIPERNWSRVEIASWAGTTPETVVRSLAHLERRGHISLKGRHIEILDRASLEALTTA